MFIRNALIALALAPMTKPATAHSHYLLLPNSFDLGKRDHVSVQASFADVGE